VIRTFVPEHNRVRRYPVAGIVIGFALAPAPLVILRGGGRQGKRRNKTHSSNHLFSSNALDNAVARRISQVTASEFNRDSRVAFYSVLCWEEPHSTTWRKQSQNGSRLQKFLR
jgi:hypothetical protein